MQAIQPEADSSSAVGDKALKNSGSLRATSVWIIICLLIFLWWASTYSSLVEVLAEWQFALLGRYYPSLTVIAVVLLLALPVAAVVGWRRRRQRRRLDGATRLDPMAAMARAIRSAERSRAFFLLITAVTAVAAAVALLSMLWLPSSEGTVRVVSGIDGSVQPEGPAAYARPFGIGGVARIEENVGLARRVMYVAPVHLGGQHRGNSFLTTVDPSDTRPIRFTPIASGVLVEQGIPRELTNLYRIVDVGIADRSYLLMRDGATMRWRPIVLGVQVALLSLVSFVMAMLFHRQVRRLGRTVERSTDISG